MKKGNAMLKSIFNTAILFAVMCIFALASCAPISDSAGAINGGGADSSNRNGVPITITLPSIKSKSVSIRALTDEQRSRLERETAKYRVTFSSAGQMSTREGDGTTYSAYFPVGAQVGITVYCLNSNDEVIVETVTKTITVSSGANRLDFKLSEDGTELYPDTPKPTPEPPKPVPNKVTYDWGEANKHGTKNGLPSDSTTYNEGDLFTVEDGASMTWDHGNFAGYWEVSPQVLPEGETVDTTGSVSPGQKYQMPKGGVVLTAQWDKKTYKITYHENAPSNATGSATITWGQDNPTTNPTEVTALDSASVFSGQSPTSSQFDSKNWTFMGWNTQANGLGDDYDAGDPIRQVTENIDLYAKWSDKNVWTVTYNKGNTQANEQDITGWKGSDNVEDEKSVTLPTLQATGYRFDGWQITGEAGNKTGSYTPTGNVDATAQWTLITYTITYNPDGGNVDTSFGATEFDVTTGTINFPQANGKTGYSFDCWKTADGNRVTVYDSSQLAALVPSGSTTLALTAVWSEKTYNIEYTVASGEGTGSATATFTIGGGNVTLNDGTAGFTRSGYRIASWKYDDNSSAGNAGAQVAVATLIAKADAGGSNSLQLTAVWTPIQYTITYNANGGGNNPGNTIFTVADGTVTLDTGSSLSKAGSAFAGWSTQQNGTAITDTSASALIGLMSGSNTSVTLYAVWKTGFDVTDSSGSTTNYTTFDTAYTNAIAKTGAVTITLYSDASGVVKDLSNVTTPSSLTIDLNGRTITGNGTDSVFTVQGKGVPLTVKDTSVNANGKITGGETGVEVNVYTDFANNDYAAGSFTLESGYITGNTNYGVYVLGSSFTMNGGTISEQTNGYGVYVSMHASVTGATYFIMNTGTITMNKIGVYTYGTGDASGWFTKNGGELSGNTQDTDHRQVVY